MVTPLIAGSGVTVSPATGLPVRLLVTVPETVPVLVPGGPEGPGAPARPVQATTTEKASTRKLSQSRILHDLSRGKSFSSGIIPPAGPCRAPLYCEVNHPVTNFNPFLAGKSIDIVRSVGPITLRGLPISY